VCLFIRQKTIVRLFFQTFNRPEFAVIRCVLWLAAQFHPLATWRPPRDIGHVVAMAKAGAMPVVVLGAPLTITVDADADADALPRIRFHAPSVAGSRDAAAACSPRPATSRTPC